MSTLKIDNAFIEALTGEDDLGRVVRAHIHVESTLIDFINEKLTDLKTLSRLRYSQRVELACELGLNDELKEPLKVLGEIRNDFAHKINAELSKQKVDRFLNSFDRALQDFFQTLYESSGSPMLERCPKFLDLSPRDMFTIMVTALKARVVVELYNTKCTSAP